MDAKKIMVVMGSPRKNGNSATLAHRVIEGAQSGGAEVESYYLNGMNLKPCTACGICRDDSGTDCNIDDDMKNVYPKLRRADALVIATPVYWCSMSAQTKLFMDRMYALGGPQGSSLKKKRFGILITYGDEDPVNSGAIDVIRTFQDVCNYLDSPIIDIVYGSADEPGEIGKNRVLMERAYALGTALATA